jgi:hypothetical protein
VLPLTRGPGGVLGVAIPQAPALAGVTVGMPSAPVPFAKGGVPGRDIRAAVVPSGQAAAARAGAPVINITNSHPSARVEAQNGPGGQDMSIDIIIEQIDSGLAERMSRGVGPSAALMGQAFGLSRRGR